MVAEISGDSSNRRLLMVQIACRFLAVVAALALVLLVAGPVSADAVVVAPPTVAWYYPAPTVTYYRAPAVVAPAPVVSYYYAPAVTYYAPPVSYYAAPAAVTTTYYGLLHRPRAVTTYYTPVYIAR
jgi:hypothetical protein